VVSEALPVPLLVLLHPNGQAATWHAARRSLTTGIFTSMFNPFHPAFENGALKLLVGIFLLLIWLVTKYLYYSIPIPVSPIETSVISGDHQI